MMVGHYAVCLAAKKYEKQASLGMLFLAVQFVDIIFGFLVLSGIEKINIIENYTQSTHFELAYFPYSHGLVAALFWTLLTYVAFRFLAPKNTKVALVMALAVFSHWILDLITHTPDLPLLTDSSVKLGFGLWNSALATYATEAALLLAGLWLYLTATTARSKAGRYGMIVFVAFLLLINIPNIFGPLPDLGKTTIMISALVTYFVFALIGFWLDKHRV